MGQLSVLGSIFLYVVTFGLSGLLSIVPVRNKFIKILLVMLPPVLLATFRYKVGYDYGTYIYGYEVFSQREFSEIFQDYQTGDPIAFYLVTKFAAMLGSERIYLMVLAILALLPATIFILTEWTDKKTLPLVIFCHMFNGFLFSLSACKQGIAISILMLSLKYVYNRKPLKFLLCVAVAFLFHSTAIVFIVVYFFLNSKGNMSTFKKILIVAGCIFVILNLQPILEGFLDGKYEGYATNIVEGKNRTFWLYSAITLIFLFFRDKFVEIDKRNDLFIMMMAVGAIFQYLGFTNAFSKRIGEYFLIAEVFLIPQSVYVFTQNSRKVVNLLIVVYIVALFLIATPIAESGMGFVPYQYKFW